MDEFWLAIGHPLWGIAFDDNGFVKRKKMFDDSGLGQAMSVAGAHPNAERNFRVLYRRVGVQVQWVLQVRESYGAPWCDVPFVEDLPQKPVTSDPPVSTL